MKKTSFKIFRGLKGALAVAFLVGGMYLTSKLPTQAKASLAFVGVAAGLKSKGKWDALDDNTKAYIEQQDTVLEEAHKNREELKAQVEDLKKKGLTDEQLNDLKEISDLKETVKKQATKIDQLLNKAADEDHTGTIAKALKENDAKIKDFLAGNSKKPLLIEVKASQTAADIATHTIGEYVSGIGQIPVRQPVIESIFPIVNVSKEFIKYMDQETVVRDAKNVAGCATTTHNTKLTWKERNIQITKVRDFIDVCQDMMDDYDFVEGEIRNLIETSVTLKVDSGLLLDDGVYPNLHSIDEVASEFDAANDLSGTITPWAGTVQAPDIYALVIAMSSQIIALGQANGYMPNTVLINTIDNYKNMVIKDKNDNYIVVPFVTKVNNKDYTIDGMRVITNPMIPANTIYVFDSTKGTIYNRRGLTVELSYENAENFETETVTIKAYRRMQLLIRNVNANAFMKSTDMAAAIAALNKAV